jgi:hypothetical protein
MSIAPTQILPPEEAVEIAWAQTIELSSNESVHSSAEIPKRQMEDKKKRAEAIGNPQVKKRELEYFESANSAIAAAYRNLTTARNSLDLNFKEAKALRDKEEENIQYLERFTASLQSLIPKAAEMTVGGVAVSVVFGGVFESFFPGSMKTYALPLLLALGAAITYFVHGLLIVPMVGKEMQRQKIHYEYDEIQYYKQYVARVASILQTLYERVERAHKDQFGKEYAPGTTATEVVKRVLLGMEQDRCKNIATCIEKKGRITPLNWSTCKTGNNASQCGYY